MKHSAAGRLLSVSGENQEKPKGGVESVALLMNHGCEDFRSEYLAR
jgi:hypothetical protein